MFRPLYERTHDGVCCPLCDRHCNRVMLTTTHTAFSSHFSTILCHLCPVTTLIKKKKKTQTRLVSYTAQME